MQPLKFRGIESRFNEQLKNLAQKESCKSKRIERRSEMLPNVKGNIQLESLGPPDKTYYTKPSKFKVQAATSNEQQAMINEQPSKGYAHYTFVNKGKSWLL